MHPDISEEKFKLALATDLVIYMLRIWTQGANDPDRIIADLMNSWSARIEASATYMKTQLSKQMAEQNEEMTEDVAMVLLDVNNIENKMMKGEFKSQMREAIFKSMGITESQPK